MTIALLGIFGCAREICHDRAVGLGRTHEAANEVCSTRAGIQEIRELNLAYYDCMTHSEVLNIEPIQVVREICSSEKGVNKVEELYRANIEKITKAAYDRLENKPNAELEKDNKLLEECQYKLDECGRKSYDISKRNLEDNKSWNN